MGVQLKLMFGTGGRASCQCLDKQCDCTIASNYTTNPVVFYSRLSSIQNSDINIKNWIRILLQCNHLD